MGLFDSGKLLELRTKERGDKMKEKCIKCQNSGEDEQGGYFYTPVCGACREKPRFSMYLERKVIK